MFKKLALLLLLCFSCTKKAPEENQKPTILVTLAPYAFVTEYIVGETAKVKTLIPPGMNIHIYEPKPRQVSETGQAAIWFQITEPFEKRIEKAFREKNPSMRFVNLQKGLDLLSPHSGVEFGSTCGHHHGSFDLHTWTSPRMLLQQSKTIADTLIALYPEHTTLYQKNFNNLALQLKTLDRNIEKMLTPFKGDAILVSHPALSYFCKDYGLLQISVECEGKDPRPKDIEKILAQAKNYTVRTVFLQQGFNNRGASLIGKKLHIPIHRIDPFAKDYLKNMLQIAEYISK